MGMVKEKGVSLFEEFLDFGVVAGFTDTRYSGLTIEEDIAGIASSLDVTYDRVFSLKQVHASDVIRPKDDPCPIGDSLISDRKREVLIVRTADCLPLFFYDPKKRIVGVKIGRAHV